MVHFTQTISLYDLHSHSTASDGSLAPRQLVAHAAQRGVKHLALTDHDSVSGIEEGRIAAKEWGVRLIAGCEISVSWQGMVLHILGLAVDPQHPELTAGLDELRRRRVLRARQIADKLERAGITEAFEDAQRRAAGGAVGRMHFAQLLIDRGYVRDAEAAFRRYLRRGCRAYVAIEWATLEEALHWIGVAGGIPVLAHPARYALSSTRMGQLLACFSAAGGGIEVVSGAHNPAEVRRFTDYAQRYGLCASVGSDFHGPGKGYADLGQVGPLPASLEPIWQRWPECSGESAF